MASNSTTTQPSTPAGDEVVVTVADIRRLGIANLDRLPEGYYDSGADEEQTLRENVAAFYRLRLRPRMLHGVAVRDKAVTLLGGQKLSMPIAISPTAFQKMAHPDGEKATARAAQKASTLMILSTLSNTTMEDVAGAAPNGQRWFQLYVYKDRDITKNLVQRAEKSGYKALVLTVDTPTFGQRIIDVKNNFTLPEGLTVANLEGVGGGLDPSSGSGLDAYGEKLFDPSLTWDVIKWLKGITKLPIIAKGVLTAEDAREAVSHGVSAILVSNHGGRQLDGVTSTIEALPEIIKAVSGRVEVYLDGGVRHGTDAIKALALGAKAVFLGRPVLWGLAYKGEDGVSKVLEIMRKELDRAMELIGASSINELRPEMVSRQEFYARL